MTAQTRRIVNHCLKALYQIDLDHINYENATVIKHLIDWLKDEKEGDL